MASLYNAVEGASLARFRAFLHILRYAAAVKRADLVVPVFDRLESWYARTVCRECRECLCCAVLCCAALRGADTWIGR